MKLTPAQKISNTVRLNLRQAESCRSKIRVTELLTRLQHFALGEKVKKGRAKRETRIQMTSDEIAAAKLLLSLCLPALARVEHIGDGGGPVQVQNVPVAPEEASRAYLDMLTPNDARTTH